MFNPAAIREFTPQNYDISNTVPPPDCSVQGARLLIQSQNSNGATQENGLYNDPFTTMGSIGTALPSAGQFNLYASEHNALATSGGSFYPQHGAFPAGPLQPPNYHLYQPFDSYRQELQPWQRATYDFFMPAKMREELQKKMFATQQVMPSESNARSLSLPLGLANALKIPACPSSNAGTRCFPSTQTTERTRRLLGTRVGYTRLRIAEPGDTTPCGGSKVKRFAQLVPVRELQSC